MTEKGAGITEKGAGMTRKMSSPYFPFWSSSRKWGSIPSILYFTIILSLCIIFTSIFNPLALAQTELKVQYKADSVEYIKEKERVILSGNIELKAQNIIIKTERISLDTKNKVIYVETPFELKQIVDNKEQLIKGKSLEYDLNIKRAICTDAFIEIPANSPDQNVYIYGESITVYENGSRIVVKNGNFTTCNHRATGGDTHYSLAASIIDYIPDSRIFAWDASVYIMEKRVFWYPFLVIPLEKIEYNLDIGRNEVEGLFLRTKNYYYINEQHDGWIFNNFIEKKGIGTGFEHVWLNLPHSISIFYFYGIPFNGPLLEIYKFQGPYFNDRELMLRHKQRITDNTEAEVMFNDKKFYNISSYQAPKDIFTEFKLNLSNNELLELPLIDIDSKLNLNLNYRKGTNENIQPTYIRRNIGENINLTGNLSLNLAKNANLNLNTNWQQNINWIEQEGQNLPSPLPTPNISKNFTNSLQFSQEILPSLKLNSSIRHWRNELLSTTEPDNQMDTNITLSQDLKWGQLTLEIAKRFDFSSKANEESTIQQRNYIDKLPELTLTTQNIFKEYFPLNASIKMGRIFASSNYSLDNLYNYISRLMIDINFNGNYSLGMGFNLDYTGTSFTQRFYNTTDAEYALRGQVNISNNLLPFFIPNITYQRQIVDKESNNPLPIDKLSDNKTHTLNYRFKIGNIPEFTWDITGGYDYESKRYYDFLTNIVSRIGDSFALNLQAGYSPRNITKSDVSSQGPKLLTDYEGKEIPDLWVTEQDIGRLELRGGRWHPFLVGLKWRPWGEDFGGDFGKDEGIKQGLELGLSLGYDFNKWNFQNFYTQIAGSVGTNWLWHTEFLIESAFDLNKQKEGFLAAFNPFNKFMLKKDLHDFIFIVSYDRFYEQFSVVLSMVAFPFSTSDIQKIGM